ncbi:hypothetical protein AYJ57_20665 (plasmid) [Salipiger sp. CCB-MM3]|uniref:carbohydrate-binding protein n=1 Tax=Salipiger sp. CCB-MM3 TaxID=1792508 RepID=UPI00080AB5CA|nr:carbohydrate-binding protein [Salipiger sp. CCB-MM3]ANT62899.1 hypothetical protein AYJ57_20665 [Salipiger sp. CCB-MM3]
MPIETIIIQAEFFTLDLVGESASSPNAMRTRNDPETQPSNTPATGYDQYGLREGYTGEGDENGWGYLDINGSDTGAQASTEFVAEEAGTYAVTLRLSNGNGARPISITIGDVTVEIENTNTGDFHYWETRTVLIDVPEPGTYTLTINQTSTGGAPNVDAVAIHDPAITPDFSAPVFLGQTDFLMNENSLAVGAVSAQDIANDTSPDAASRAGMSYAIVGGTDEEKFEIDADTGEISLIEPSDFAGQSSYDLLVAATDAEGSATTQAVSVTVIDNGGSSFETTYVAAEDLVRIDGAGSASVLRSIDGEVESSASGTNTGAAEDGYPFDEHFLRHNYSGIGYVDVNGDPGDKISTSFSSGAGVYDIAIRLTNGASDQPRPISVKVDGVVVGSLENTRTADWSTWEVHTFTVILDEGDHEVIITQDDDGAPNIDAVMIGFTGQEMSFFAPEITSSSEFSVAEGETFIGQVFADDQDDTDFTFALRGADAEALEIDESGNLSLLSSADFEMPTDEDEDGIYEVIVDVSDGSQTSSQEISVTVSDVEPDPDNTAPTFAGESLEIEIADGASVVATGLWAVDAEGNPITYDLVGADAEAFEYDAETGTLSLLSAAQHSAPGDMDNDGTLEVSLVASDGHLSNALTVAVTIAEPVDVPASAILLTAIDVTENLAGAVVAEVHVTDPDSSYVAADLSLAGENAEVFELVDGTTGIELKFLDGIAGDFEGAPLEVSVTLGDLSSEPFTPALIDEVEPMAVVFDETAISAYNDAQDQPEDGGAVSVSEDGSSVTLDGNFWKRVQLPESYEISADTRLTVDITLGDAMPEIVSLGFDDDDQPFEASDGSNYQLAGTQSQGGFIDLRGQGEDLGDGVLRFTIDLSAHAGTTISSLTLVSDDDAFGNGRGSVTFSNVQLFESDGEAENSGPIVVGGGIADFSVDETGVIEVDLPFTDPDGDELTYSLQVLDAEGAPAQNHGMTIAGGVLSGAAPEEPGAYTVLVTATDVAGSNSTQSTSFVLTVDNVNDAPISSAPALEPYFVQAGETIDGIDLAQFEEFFSDPDGDALTLSAENLPSGLSVDAEGVITGMPTVGGEFEITILATDPAGLSASLTISMVIEGGQIGDEIVVEAENFTGLEVADEFYATGQAGASEDRILRVGAIGDVAEVTTDLTQNGVIEGWYMVSMTRYDETDGSATYSLTIGETVLAENAAFDGTPDADSENDAFDNDNARGDAGQSGNLKTITYETPVYVSEGTVLRLSGVADGELLRTDKFTFTRIETPNSAPGAVSIDNASVAENSAGAVIGLLSATDPEDGAEGLTFSVDPASDFEIADGALKLKEGVSLDHEAGASILVDVIVTDAQGAETATTLTIAVTDVREAPSSPVITGTVVAENAEGQVIGTLSSVDPEQTAVTFEVSDDRFEVDASGQLSLKAGISLDHEAESAVQLVVTATDAAGETAQTIFEITVTDLNEAPVLGSPDALGDIEIEDGAGALVDLSILAASDPDAEAMLAFEVAEANGGTLPDGFVISGSELIIPADAPTGVYELAISVSDGELSTGPVSFAVTVGDPDAIQPFTIQAEDDSLVVIEDVGGTETGEVIRVVNADNPDDYGSYRAGAVGGEYVDFGSNPGDKITVSVSAPAAGAYELAIRYASDGDRPLSLAVNGNDSTLLDFASTDDENPWETWIDQLVTIDLEAGINTITLEIPEGYARGPNVDQMTLSYLGTTSDQAPSIPALSNASVDENADGAVIGTVSSVDPEETAVSFTVDDARFEIDGDDQLTLKSGESLDHEAEETVSVVVTATDETGQTSEATFEIAVNDLNEAPVLGTPEALADVDLDEGAGGSIDLSALGATDPDTDDEIVFEVTALGGGAMPEGFAVSGNTLIVAAETPVGIYQILVAASDGALSSGPVSFTITVGDPYAIDPITIQAEDASLVEIDDVGENAQGQVTRVVTEENPDDFGNYRAGATDDAYVDFGSDAGDKMTITVDAPIAGTYEVAFRYASSGTRPLTMSLNGGAGELVSFTGTVGAEPWEAWTDLLVTVELVAGENTVSLAIPEGSSSGPNIDQATFSFLEPAVDASADEDGDLSAYVDASVAPADLAQVQFELTGVDADIVSYAYSTDDGASFIPIVPVDGLATLDLTEFSEADAVEVIFQVTDAAGNVATTSASLQITSGAVDFAQTIQFEARDGSITITDDTPGTNGTGMTQVRDALNPEEVTAERGSDGLWDDFEGDGYLDVGSDVGDMVSFEVDVPAGGTYAFTIRYGNGSSSGDDRPMTFSVDGVVVETIPFSVTEDWDVWEDVTVEVDLSAGSNTISLTNTTANGPNLDQVVVSSVDVGPVEPEVPTEPGARETIKINFQDGTVPVVEGYLVGNFTDYGLQSNGVTYGFVTQASALDADGTTNTPVGSDYPAIAINERSGTGTLDDDGSLPAEKLTVDFDSMDARLTGYAHLDLGTTIPAVGWEIELENGWYEVTVAVGDTGGVNDSDNQLYVEGELASSYTPNSAFKTELVTTVVKVEDGHLTLTGQGGTITELQYLEIRHLPDLTPDDGNEAPEDYAAFVNPRAVSADGEMELGANGADLPVGVDPTSDIVLGIEVVDGRGGALLESLGSGAIRLYETLTGEEVAYSANTTGGFDSVTIAPSADLKPFTSYTVVIDGFLDRGENDDLDAASREFQKFSTTFVTGAAPEVEDREVAFIDTLLLESDPMLGEMYSSIEVSPDKQHLYVTSLSGTITRWELGTDGSIIEETKEVFAPGGDFEVDGARRGIIGIVFDPEDENTIWITDNYPVPLNGRSNGVPEFSGRISKVTLGEGGSLEDAEVETYVTGLPRSNGDHVTNSLEFRLNPDYVAGGSEPQYLLYLTQGSNSAMGEPDSAWGMRPERLLNAAILEIDRSLDAPEGGFDVSTEPLPDDGLNRRFEDTDNDLKNGGIYIDSGEYTGNYLHFDEDGVAEVRAGELASSELIERFYDPYAEDAVVSIFATGNRNAYDLVWHTNGYLYVPTNGSAAGGNTPDDPSTPEDESNTGVGIQHDYLFRMVEDGYYGHPNPLHDQYILNGANPTDAVDPNEVTEYEAGTDPDPDYDLEGAYSLNNNKSPNGAIEYLSDAFGSSLQNAVIFTQYSSGDNLRAVLLNEDGTVAEDFILRDPDGNIISYVDPLDVIEGADGRLYMLTLSRATGVSQIVRLETAPGGIVTDDTADEGDDLALLVISASDSSEVLFQINGLDNDIEEVAVSFDGETLEIVQLDAQNRFVRDMSDVSGEAVVAILVTDQEGNTATADTTVTPGVATGGSYIDASEFTLIDLDSGTLIRLVNVPSTHESNASTDADGDGLHDGYSGEGYLDVGGGSEEKASFIYDAPISGSYTLTFRMANGSGNARPMLIKLGDQEVEFSDTLTAGYNQWEDFQATFDLEKGINTIVIEQLTDAGGPNIDSVTIESLTPIVPNDGTETVDGLDYILYEAENALLSGPVIVSDATNPRGQSGGEFVDFDGSGTQTIEWSVLASEAGTYAMDIIYALGAGKAARPASLLVNGVDVGVLAFEANSNSGETIWGPQSAFVELAAGVNTISISVPDANGANIDYLRLSDGPVDLFDPAYAAIDGEGRIELEATDDTTRTLGDTTVEFYFTVSADDTYALDLAANAGAADGAGLRVYLTADGGDQVLIDDNGFPGVGEEGETSAYAELLAGVQYKLTVVSDQPGASDIDYLDVRPAPGNDNADIELQSADPAFYSDRLHFSWIDNPASSASSDRDFKESATVMVSNSGTEALEILEVHLTGPFELADAAALEGLTLEAGQSIGVEVLFDREAYTSGSSAVTGVFEGALELRTNDADTPIATIDLAGFWQLRDEGGHEPNVNEVWDVFGFGNEIEDLTYVSGGEDDELNFYDVYLPVDETEVLSPYWRIAEPGGEVKITQIAAFHSPGGASIGIHAPGDKSSDVVLTTHGNAQNQSLLPLLGNGAFATRAFSAADIPDGWAGDDLFGIEVAGLSTDPTLNGTGNGAPSQAELDARYPGYTVTDGQVYDPDGNPVSDGYTVRMFQAVDENGVSIENVFLGVMDYTGVNYDYNDNMFIIEGVAPVYLGGQMEISGLDDAAAGDRLVFSRIDNPANSSQAFRDVASITITNDGAAPLTIDDLSVEGAFEISGLSQGDSIAVGATAELTVTFVGTDGSDDNLAVLHEGSLTIGSNAGTREISLAGIAQIQSEGGEEPTVAQIVEAFGYSTDVAQGQLNGGGVVEQIGDEVLLPYLQRLDGSKPVEVIQIAAYLSAGVSRLSLHDVSNGALTELYAQDDNQYQTLLPDGLVAGTGALPGVARASIDRDDAFGLRVTVDGRPTYSAWSDPDANVADETYNISGTNEGHYIRFFQAKDADGNDIEGTFIGLQDYPGGSNFDYNDHMFIVTNVQAYDLSAQEDADGDGVNDALVTDSDNDGIMDFYDPEVTPQPVDQMAHSEDGAAWLVGDEGLTLMANLFDEGGQGLAYNDDGVKSGDQAVRPGENVDISVGTGAIGYTEAGEWIEYTINVETAGAYELSFNSSTPLDGRSLTASFEIDGEFYETAQAEVPNTGAFTTYADTDPVTVNLEAGEQVLRVNFDVAAQDLMSFSLMPVADAEQSPYPGPDLPTLVDGSLTIFAGHYDDGGQGIAYNDVAGLQGGTDGGRDGSDVEITSAGDIGWIENGEWAEYSINIDEAGLFDLELLMAFGGTGGRSVTVDFYRAGEDDPYASSGSIANPTTGSWTTFLARNAEGVSLEAGEQTMRVTFAGGSQDFRSITLTQQAGAIQEAYPGPAPVLDEALTVAAANFDSGGMDVSWHDDEGRDGAHSLRSDTDVELVGATADIGYIEPGEWVEYTINVAAAGSYNLSLLAKTPIGGNTISVSLEDGSPLNVFALEDSNGASSSFSGTSFTETESAEIALEAGLQTLRFTFDGDPATNGYLLDFRSFSLEKVEEVAETQMALPTAMSFIAPSLLSASVVEEATFGEIAPEDEIVFEGASFSRADVEVDLSVPSVGVDTDQDGDLDELFVMKGDFDGGEFMAVSLQGATVLSHERYLIDLEERREVAEENVNGVVNQAFLEGDGMTSFEVRLSTHGHSGKQNSLGIYEITEEGEITDVRILSENAKKAKGDMLTVDGIEAGHSLGFFLVQDGAKWARKLGDDDSFQFLTRAGETASVEDGADIFLAVNDVATSLTVFHSFSKSLNVDGIEHVVSGVTAGGEGVAIGFEDLLGGGDKDYEDLLFTVSRLPGDDLLDG